MKPGMFLAPSLCIVLAFGAYGAYGAYGDIIHEIEIPFGAHNPELNTPAEEWYSPPYLEIKAGDEITWQNADREGHTVTGGQGSGRFGWMGDDFGTPDGAFDSGRFMPGESWSRTFAEAGAFPYFCTIHPWMEGTILAEPLVPDYPHDAAGNRIDLPAVSYTGDGMVELDVTWEPNVIRTGQKVALIYQTYDPATNSNLDKMGYDLVITQGGAEVFRDSGVTSVGGDYRYVVFERPGPVEIKFENITSWGSSGIGSAVRGQQALPHLRSVELTAIVYENPLAAHTGEIIQPRQTLQFYYEIAVLLVIVPGALFVYVLYKMKTGPRGAGARAGPI